MFARVSVYEVPVERVGAAAQSFGGRSTRFVR
jgi:hypothetical protein